MKAKQLQYFENQLLDLQEELLGVEGLLGDASTIELGQTRVGRLSRLDILQQHGMAQAGSEQREQHLRRITLALARIDDSCYGECLKCLQSIPNARLEIDPAVEYCMNCAQ